MIGLFDSGIGGLTVVRRVFELLPDSQVVYFGDTARVPYGTRSAPTIIRYARQDADFLVTQGARLLVVACNTASAVALEELTGAYPLPILGVVEPAIAAAAQVTRGKIGVIGTRATVNSGIYERKLAVAAPGAEVRSVPAPLLVPLVEENWLDGPETTLTLERYLQPLVAWGADTLIMACTHYPLLSAAIGRIMGQGVELVDPGLETAKRLRDLLAADPALAASVRGTKHRFYLSDLTEHFAWLSEQILGRPVEHLARVAVE